MPIARDLGGKRLLVRGFLAALCSLGLGARPGAGQEPSTKSSPPRHGSQWRGVHLTAPGHGGVPLLKRAIVEKLAPLGVNVLILEVNYNFVFASHPELRGGGNGALRVEDARD